MSHGVVSRRAVKHHDCRIVYRRQDVESKEVKEAFFTIYIQLWSKDSGAKRDDARIGKRKCRKHVPI